MTETSDTRNVYQRLADARANFAPIVRGASGQVGTRHYQYADLKTVLDAVEPALAAEGLILVQTVTGGNPVASSDRAGGGFGGVETALVCLDGAPATRSVLSAFISLPPDLTEPQKVGSAITYYRRYGVVCLLGLTTEEDDDGAKASGTSTRTRQATAAQLPVPEVPEGWESHEQSVTAHEALRVRILALPQDFAEKAIAFRQEHGWALGARQVQRAGRPSPAGRRLLPVVTDTPRTVEPEALFELKRPVWQAQAACHPDVIPDGWQEWAPVHDNGQRYPVDLFFPEASRAQGRQRAFIADLCGSCPVRGECALWAIGHEQFGYWGDLGPEAMRDGREETLTRLQTPEVDPETKHIIGTFIPPGHGTYQRFRKHLRDGDKPCDACSQAQRINAQPRRSEAWKVTKATETPDERQRRLDDRRGRDKRNRV